MAPLSQRSSVAPMSRARMSVAPGGSNARLAAKQAELQALQHLRSESANLAHEMAQLGDRVDTLVAGGSTVSSVMASWQGVFRAIQIAQATIHVSRDASEQDTESPDARQVPDALVRIPIQQSEQTQ
ncbi:DASH complex subunit dad2 [Malassezia japonica]|uniref:DASH complex subunit DAD2 n=1 Tax=Malassezia japonica TaxID=223818 RepID=A0AAF0EY90_9BASI|nr:DASH complex subunit dad2 [Malassezia japonica]WFD37280.1 DASH complex subunit dad2 [Malassezia japonica]